MVVLGGGAVSYERGAPVTDGGFVQEAAGALRCARLKGPFGGGALRRKGPFGGGAFQMRGAFQI